MTIRLYDSVAIADFPIYRDSENLLQFWYLPQRFELGGPSHNPRFTARLNRDGGAGAAKYEFRCYTNSPDDEHLSAVRRIVRDRFGYEAKLDDYYEYLLGEPVLQALTDLPYIEIGCGGWRTGVHGLNCHFTVPESIEPGLAEFIQTAGIAWAGEIVFTLEYAKVTAYWCASSDQYCEQVMWEYFNRHPNPQIGQGGPYPKWEIYDERGRPGLFYRTTEALLAEGFLHFSALSGAISEVRRIELMCEALIKKNIFYRNIHDNKIHINRWGKWDEYDGVHVNGCECELHRRPIKLGMTLGRIPKTCFVGYD